MIPATHVVFLNASLSHMAAQMFNREVQKLLSREGFDCIVPQDELPPGPSIDPVEVFKGNVDFVRRCDIVLSVLDAPGEGVIFELGVAYALGKTIVAFRSDQQSYLGKVLEGLWLTLPASQKATTLEELEAILKCLRQALA